MKQVIGHLAVVMTLALSVRYEAAAEGITGQFHLANLVARLVAMQMSASPSSTSRS